MLRQIFALLILIFSLSAHAADKDFSSWRKFTEGKFVSETMSVAPGSSASVGLYVTLADKWHTYWVNPGDSGAALRLDFKNSPGVKVKAVRMPVPERVLSGPLISFAYSHEVLFPIEIEIDKSVMPGSTIHIEADAEWLVCDEVCIPAIDTLVLDIPVTALEEVRPSPMFGTFQKFWARIPAVVPQFPKYFDAGDSVELTLEATAKGQKFVEFFPFRGSGVTNEKPTAEFEEGILVLRFKKANVARQGEDRVGVFLYSQEENGEASMHAVQFGEPKWSFTEAGAASDASGPELWWMLFSAFLGGLILNLMPCVFPILSIKLLSILKISSQSAHLVRKQNLGYVAGVMISFLVIALVLAAMRSAGHLVGWGFQLQSPVFLSFLSWLFLVLAMNLLGLFEIDFINAGAGGRWTRLGGFWGSFFTGVLAVVVASPCTAPFMGVALGFGISQPTPVLMAVFLSLGFGLAFPYALMIVVPSALWFLPKPGAWMETLKKIMAVPLLLTIVWLLWVLSQVSGPVAMIAAIGGCVVLGLFCVIQMPRKLKVSGALLTLVAMLLFIGSLKTSAKTESHAGWMPYSESMMAELKGNPVFVNMTADWCLTCKVNEKLIFSDADVLELLRKKNVTLVMGDWTQRNDEITRFLSRFDRVGVPFYVLFSARNPNGRVLPEVMTKSSFIEEIKNEFP